MSSCSHDSLAPKFSILHVNLCCFGDSINYERKYYFLNAMCDITQSVVTIPITGCTFAIIVRQFVQEFLMMFGICYLVVIDDGTPLKCVFTVMCDCL